MMIKDVLKLSPQQLATWEEAYNKAKLPVPEFICFGKLPKYKSWKPFFKPFLEAKTIHFDTLKYCGVFRLTAQGVQDWEALKKF